MTLLSLTDIIQLSGNFKRLRVNTGVSHLEPAATAETLLGNNLKLSSEMFVSQQ